jgi:serine/threonine-protein kinase RsbW
MTTPPKRVEVTLETTLDSVDLGEDITLRLAEAAGFGEEERYRIGIAVREGLINAIMYGNEQSRRKKVHLTIEFAPEKLNILILDEGKGFELSEVPDPLAEENLLKNTGRGILLMRSFMDEFEVSRGEHGGARVRMAKRYPANRTAGG